MKSFCNDHHVRIITWNQDAVDETVTPKGTVSRSVLSFIRFIETTKRYFQKTQSMSDSIQDFCKEIVVIDSLPVTLHPSFQQQGRFQQDQYLLTFYFVK